MVEVTENEIVECQVKVSSIKQHASDLQAFFAMKELEKDVFIKDKFLQSLLDKNTSKQMSMIFRPSAILQTLVSDAQTFGKVLIENKPNKVVLNRYKGKQAQMTVVKVNSYAIDCISLKLFKTIEEPGFDIRDCCLLPDGRTAFTNYFDNNIRICNTNGSFDCDVDANCLAFGLECINKDTLIVTSGYSTNHSITFIDLIDKQIKKRKTLKKTAYGIAGGDGGPIYYSSSDGIHVINLQDESEHKIVREEWFGSCYVATFANNIYHTNPDKNSVTCYDLKGNKLWTFKKDDNLKHPLGISVDNNGNVFVVGLRSENVVVISADGTRNREVLSSKDGCYQPWSLHYNRSSRHFLVANTAAKAFIYNCI